MTKVTLEIKRPDGTIETVDVSAKFSFMNQIMFGKIKGATAKAGKGECLSFNVTHTDDRTEEQKKAQEKEEIRYLAAKAAEKSAYRSITMLAKAGM